MLCLGATIPLECYEIGRAMDPITLLVMSAGFLTSLVAARVLSAKLQRDRRNDVHYSTAEAMNLLQQGKVEEWNELRSILDSWIPDLRNAKLENTTLPGTNFRYVDLRNASLKGAVLDGCDFTAASLNGTVFTDSSLDGAVFERAQLEGATFQNAKCSNLRLNGSVGAPLELVQAGMTTEFHLENILMQDREAQRDSIFRLTPYQFEEFIAKLLAKNSYTITATFGGYSGYDFLIKKIDPLEGARQTLVECKALSRGQRIGVGSVRPLIMANKKLGADGIIISRNELTESAQDLLRSMNSVRFMSINDILDLCASASSAQSENALRHKDEHRRILYNICVVGTRGCGKTALIMKLTNPLLVSIGELIPTKYSEFFGTAIVENKDDVSVQHVFDYHEWGGEFLPEALGAMRDLGYVDGRSDVGTRRPGVSALLLVVDLGSQSFDKSRALFQSTEYFCAPVLRFLLSESIQAHMKTLILFINKSDLLKDWRQETEQAATSLYETLIQELSKQFHGDLHVIVGSALTEHGLHKLNTTLIRSIIPADVKTELPRIGISS